MNGPSPTSAPGTELALRIEAQDAYYARLCVDIHRGMFSASRAAHVDVAGGVATFVDAGSPLTKVLGIGMSESVDPHAMDTVESFFRERGGIVRVDLCPYARPEVVRELSLRGYRPEGWKNQFVRRLDTVDALATAAAGSAIEVREVGLEERRAWVETVSDGFNEHPGQPDPHLELYELMGTVPGNVLFLAYRDGKPAGGGCIGIENGLASLVCTSVRREHRRHGVHAALLRARLDYAVRHGCALARIAANPGSDSQRNIERFGFQMVYSRIVLWRDLTAASAG